MAAHAWVIREYLNDLVSLAVANGMPWERVDAALRGVMGNYEAALKDIEWNHQERLKWRAAYYALGGTAQDRDKLIEGVDLR